jgi:hypothetical protein
MIATKLPTLHLSESVAVGLETVWKISEGFSTGRPWQKAAADRGFFVPCWRPRTPISEPIPIFQTVSLSTGVKIALVEELFSWFWGGPARAMSHTKYTCIITYYAKDDKARAAPELK